MHELHQSTSMGATQQEVEGEPLVTRLHGTASQEEKQNKKESERWQRSPGKAARFGHAPVADAFVGSQAERDPSIGVTAVGSIGTVLQESLRPEDLTSPGTRSGHNSCTDTERTHVQGHAHGVRVLQSTLLPRCMHHAAARYLSVPSLHLMQLPPR